MDVSGDGENNEGIEPLAVYRAQILGDVTVNALVVRRPPQGPERSARWSRDERVVGWFQRSVLHGPGAFLVVADGFEDYERAMTVKLLRELVLPLLSGWPTSPGAS